ncbi:MAG: FHA domain-containing protein [Luteimonas sp.]
MPARLTAYLPDDAAVSRLLDVDWTRNIGRDPACTLCIGHPSVSRHHAELRGDGDGWRLRDHDSKNGRHIDGARVHDARLMGDGWLRLGDVYCEFALLDAAAAAASAGRVQARQALDTQMDVLGGAQQLRWQRIVAARAAVP